MQQQPNPTTTPDPAYLPGRVANTRFHITSDGLVTMDMPQPRIVEARHLEPGMGVIRDGFADPLTVAIVQQYAADTILVSFDEAAGEQPYHPQEHVTVVGAPASQVIDPVPPSSRLLSAVRAVIDAGRLDWDGGIDVDRIQGEAHSRLVAAYEAAVGKPADATGDLRQRFADQLHRIADDIVRLELPLKATLSATLNLGVVNSRADLKRLAEYLGTDITMCGTNGDIPVALYRILLDGREYGPWLDVRAQSPTEPRESELERLRARNAELEAQIAAGGAR